MAAVETPPDRHRVPRKISDGLHQRNSPASHPGRADRPFQLWSEVRRGGTGHTALGCHRASVMAQLLPLLTPALPALAMGMEPQVTPYQYPVR